MVSPMLMTARSADLAIASTGKGVRVRVAEGVAVGLWVAVAVRVAVGSPRTTRTTIEEFWAFLAAAAA